MGYISGPDAVNSMKLDQAIRWHLRGNHYPPYGENFVEAIIPVIKKVIKWAKAYNEAYEIGLQDEIGRKLIRLPKGIEFRGKKLVDPGDLIESLHLDCFLQ